MADSREQYGQRSGPYDRPQTQADDRNYQHHYQHLAPLGQPAIKPMVPDSLMANIISTVATRTRPAIKSLPKVTKQTCQHARLKKQPAPLICLTLDPRVNKAQANMFRNILCSRALISMLCCRHQANKLCKRLRVLSPQGASPKLGPLPKDFPPDLDP